MDQVEKQERPVSEFLQKHGELLAAVISGILIAFAFVLKEAAPYLFGAAFLIGGFAKAKEGIEDLVFEKSLNVEILMILAAIGSAIIGYWAEGAILIFIFSLSGALETYTLNKSERDLSALMALQPEEALVIRDHKEIIIPASQLVLGDHVLIKPGERIPTDGRIIKGRSSINEAAITGESIPVEKALQDDVFAGTVNVNGALTVEVTKQSEETLFHKIIELVQSAKSEKSPSQLFIERFEGLYVKSVLAVVGLMLFLPHFILGWSWQETFYRAMVLLVVASPCALVAAIMPATLSAISNGARNGILFKGGLHIEKLGAIKAVAFDKTGTLTTGKPEVTDMLVRNDLEEDTLLTIAASIERHSTHPLGQAIVRCAEKQELSFLPVEEMEDVSGWGVKAEVNGQSYKIGKLSFVNEASAKAFHSGAAETLQAEGKTVVFIEDEKGIAGMIALKDIVRKETVTAIKALKKVGIHTIMITGDNEHTAKAIAKEAGIDEYLSERLPEEKLNTISELKEKYGMVAMVGDGINDAPALASANIGIAMGAGTDAALEASDVVLMKNDLIRISEAIAISQKMKKIVKQNIVFALSVILLLIASNFLQFLSLPLGVIGHEGSTILVILNGLRMLKE
ncbi:heavy metal translocating P-type ATPase [Bacillus taeanensis]|uniref:Cadmium-translocating P-type ATPase n=1 Tax=Bacillus taeanensis TaxID=273032 RepID=A0A366XSR6_9BACI|nr:heavy metal translocating P-type ATPase [Bacillus taeanensis]RBW68195.1 cadmium-translocating P-type ATPase [Bacillus taeanensis]